MPEGLGAGAVAEEMTRHDEGRGEERETNSHDRVLSICEAVLLAIVAILAAYTGFASAKWSTTSSLDLARASAARTEANRFDLEALSTKNFDSSTFNAWFSAYLAGNKQGEQVAYRRFRPGYRVAFDAWLATDPFTNPKAPPGPSYMPEYRLPQQTAANHLDALASASYKAGADAGAHSDDYVRDTIYLATILFLVGISGNFRFFRIRLALVSLGFVMLIAAVAIIVSSPLAS